MRRDRNVVDVDVLLADQVEQQIERSLINISHGHGEGEVAFRRRLLRSRHLDNRRERASAFRRSQVRGREF